MTKSRSLLTARQPGLQTLLTLSLSQSTFDIYPMSTSKIQGGQLWKQDGTGEIYLVTRVYNEALSTVAMLRKSGAESEPLLRVRVERTPTGQTIPGFTPAQDDENF